MLKGSAEEESNEQVDVEGGKIDTRVICNHVQSQRIHQHTGLPISRPVDVAAHDGLNQPRRSFGVQLRWHRFVEDLFVEDPEREQAMFLMDEELGQHL